ncbi:MAG: amino acid adenylation domain-containing protein, partial [Acidobacteriota bacterium]
MSCLVLLLACWQILIWRITRENNTFLGCSIDGRKYEELNDLPGPFTKYLPVPTQCQSGIRFSELLKLVQQAVETASEWQESFTFEEIANQTNYTLPYFPLCFEYEDLSTTVKVASINFTITKLYSCSECFDLKLVGLRRFDSLTFELHFNPDLFDEAAAHTLASCFQVLLLNAIDNARLPIDSLTVIDPELEQEILCIAEGGCKEYPFNILTHQLFEGQVIRTPDAVAVEYAEKLVSYRELNERANRLARYLQSQGIGPERLVAILLEDPVDMITAVIATLKAGGAYLPLDSLNPPERIVFILEDADVTLFLTESRFEAYATHYQRAKIDLDVAYTSINEQSSEDLLNIAIPDNLAYVIYTSGSTGRPKGVMIPHRGLSNYVHWCIDRYEITSGQGATLHSSFAFDLSLTSLFTPLLAGRKVIPVNAIANVEALATLVREKNGFSFIKLTPAHVRLLGQQLSPDKVKDLTQCLIIGGEALSYQEIAFWRQHATEMLIINEYGPTETVVGCCVYNVPTNAEEAGSVPIGRPIDNVRLYVLDQSMLLLPPGVPGELYIGGVGLARGYLNKPVLTAERFLPDPFSNEPSARLYRTGDLVVLQPDGNLQFLGRIDQQIKIRGYRVELGEIEDELTNHHSVSAVAVIAQQDQDGGLRLIAYIVPNNIGQLDTALVSELRGFLVEKLPEYMIPTEYVILTALPLTENGKIDRKALLSVDQVASRAVSIYVAPRTPTEEIMTGIWSQALGIDKIGIDDNYFALGGDSIRSIQVVARAQESGLCLTIDQIFNHKTIRALAQAITDLYKEDENLEITEPFGLISESDRLKLPQDIEDAYPLTRLQAGMVYHRELSPESAVYHDIFTFHLKAPLNIKLMKIAIEQLAVRHPILRASFDLTNYSIPLQLIHKHSDIPFVVMDLSNLTIKEQESALFDWLETEKQRDFDYTRPPLLRFNIFIRSCETFVFALAFHHAILDGWSDANMLIELALSYRALLYNEISPFISPKAKFRDFVALEIAALKSAEHRHFWLEKMSDSSMMRLSERYTYIHGTDHRRAVTVEIIPINSNISDQLQKLARTMAVPLKSVLLAAHMRVMGLLSGQSDVVTTMTSVGRPETEDGDKVLGLHLNSLPFRVKMSGGSWRKLIYDIFELEREAIPFRRFPMSEIQILLGRSNLAETHFYFTHYHIVHKLEQFPEMEILDQNGYEETSFALVANFTLNPRTNQLMPFISYDNTRLDNEQGKNIAGYYAKVLETIVRDLDAHYESWCLLSDAEQQTLLNWNNTYTAFPDTNISDIFDVQVQSTPNAIAAIFNGQQYSYYDLSCRANQLARYLRARGAGLEMPIGICMERSLNLAIGILAILKVGSAYLPLDPSYPSERLQFMMVEAGASLLLTEQANADRLPTLQASVVCVDSDWQLIAKESVESLNIKIAADNLVYIIYTSGSTGKPKGIGLTHRALTNLNYWHNNSHISGARTLQFASISFDVSFYEMFVTWLSGGVVVFPSESLRQDIFELTRFLREMRIEKVILPVIMLQHLAEIYESGSLALPALKEIISTGEQLRITEPIMKLFKQLDGCCLYNHYGPSESHVVTTFKLQTEPEYWDQLPAIGQPIANCQIYILDEYLQPVPIGAVGELYIGGVALARGYYNRPELTAEKFIPNPFIVGTNSA